jgi:regulator of sigma E protease
MLLNILKFPLIVIEVLVVFNLMIIVHELGHFLAAKWRGLVIEKFGIWFGKPLWKKTIGGVEYSFGTLPFGGFVALPQMVTMEAIEGKNETPRDQLPNVSALSKIIVAFAGPLFSFGLAVVFATVVWLVGRPVSEGEATTTIGYVMPDSPAAAVHLRAGDKILSVDGAPVTSFSGMGSDTIQWRIVRSEGDSIPVTYQRTVNGVTSVKTAYPKPEIEPTKPWMRKSTREIGILPAQHPMVAEVQPGSAADKAGLKPNDIIVRIDGQPAYTLDAVADYVKDHRSPSHTLDVEREGKIVQLAFSPSGARIRDVRDGSPAAGAGLKAGDTITAVDGIAMPDGIAISDYIHAHGDRPVQFAVQDEKGGTRTLAITPKVPDGQTKPLIGLDWDLEQLFGITEDAYGKFQILHPNPIEQVRSGMTSIFNTVGAIASPKSDVKLQHMGGPVMMMRVYYMFFQSREGWRLALWFSVVLNVNLALLNLLPIPVLDGGHIALSLIEAVRRRPVNLRFLEVVQTSCAVAIIGFMLYIMFFDVQDLPLVQRLFGSKPDALHFETKDAAPAQSQR